MQKSIRAGALLRCENYGSIMPASACPKFGFSGKMSECQTSRIHWGVHATFRVRINSLDAFDQTHYKSCHREFLYPAPDNERPGFLSTAPESLASASSRGNAEGSAQGRAKGPC